MTFEAPSRSPSRKKETVPFASFRSDGKNCVFAGSGAKGAKDGPLKEAEFAIPNGLAISPDHRTLTIVNGGGGMKEAIRRIDLPATAELGCDGARKISERSGK